MSTKADQAYDAIPFPTQPLPRSQPDHLAALATLFGMRPQPPSRARVLEVGCATGGNLLPWAERYPEGHFVGIDYSHGQIVAAQAAANLLGLTNVELRQMSLVDVDETLGKFDYIIAHGLFSWVSPEVQEKLLALCRANLNPQGVVYLSYNIYPGWHLHDMIRRLLWLAAPPDRGDLERVAQGRKLLEFLAVATADDPSDWGRMLRGEVTTLLKQPDGYLRHEHFEDENHPLYFREFADRASAHGLQYLGDATLGTMFAANFGSTIEQNLLQLGGGVIATEQHMDLLRNRAFRQSLVCHDDVSLVRHLTGNCLDKLYLAAQLRPEHEPCDVTSQAPERFLAPDGAAIGSTVPTIKAALYELATRWPRGCSLDELMSAATSRLAKAPAGPQGNLLERNALAEYLVQCVAGNFVEIYSEPDNFVRSVTARPYASRVARVQAVRAEMVTNRRHEKVALDEVSYNVLPYLDGQHDRQELLQLLLARLERGDLSILVNGIPATRGEAVEKILSDALNQSLERLAQSALLTA